MAPKEIHDARISIPNNDSCNQQYNANASCHDPRQYILALILHCPEKQRDATHQVDWCQDSARVEEYHCNWVWNERLLAGRIKIFLHTYALCVRDTYVQVLYYRHTSRLSKRLIIFGRYFDWDKTCLWVSNLKKQLSIDVLTSVQSFPRF